MVFSPWLFLIVCSVVMGLTLDMRMKNATISMGEQSDVHLFRDGANTLRTDADLVVDGTLTAGGQNILTQLALMQQQLQILQDQISQLRMQNISQNGQIAALQDQVASFAPTSIAIDGFQFVSNRADESCEGTSDSQWGDFLCVPSSTPAIGDQMTASFLLSNGTYNVFFKYQRNIDGAIVRIRLDGVAIGADVDQYASTPSTFVLTILRIPVIGSMFHTLSIQVVGKNASNSVGPYLLFYGVDFLKVD